jgi:transketolase
VRRRRYDAAMAQAPVRGITEDRELAKRAVNTIRFLAVDAVEKAKSGHPGMPMGMADTAFVLWTRVLRYQPQDPGWPDRDRFVLSAGHGSMLLYAMLHLAGYDLPLAEIERFRRLASRTPGHPEHGHTPGVETTTGPLGQGFGNGVGMALAARMLAARFNHDAFCPVTHRVFGICSDGDLMEGVSSEAASLAGHWGLGNLIYVYDDNHVTIEGDTSLAWNEDVAERFNAYGWHVQHAPFDDHEALASAFEFAIAETARPSLIIVRSHIGYGAPGKQDTREAHGEPLGAAETAGAKRALGWPESPPFRVPAAGRALFAARAATLRKEYDAWNTARDEWVRREPERAQLFQSMLERRVPDDLYDRLIAGAPTKAAATRAHGHDVLQVAAALVPSLVGGAGDLEPSTRTKIDDSLSIEKDHFVGRNLHFGIREHGMASICNGMALHGGFIPYGASFLIFTDYARPSLRLSALMGAQVIWVLTHDSVFLGEDGPTHQPIEHLTALRAIPNFLVVRPADGLETAAAWGIALERRDGPTLLALTRQTLPALERPAGFDPRSMRRGGYVIRDADGADAITLIATGSEVGLAVEAAKRLDADGRAVRVVSMPAPQLVLTQDEAWRNALLPPGGRRVSIEAGATDYWWRFCGPRDLRIGIDRFGASAPLAELQEYFGFTPETIAERIRRWATD